MKMTKIWITIVMMAFAIVAFAGCGSGEEAETDPVTDKYATTIEFETMDLDGNRVSSNEIFAANKVTMINFWGTFCGPCIREMPEIEGISKEYSSKGVEVIGVLVDVTVDDASLTADAKAIIDDTAVTYRNFLGWSGFEKLLPEVSIPTTWFVDEEGNVLGEHIVGADPQKYREALDEYLSE